MHIINKIFDSFEEKGVRYCHFKSNQHLDESFDGIADFDILVDYKKSSICEKLLLENDCKRFEPEYIGSYPGVTNWIAFDPGTGKIFHLHLHYQLASGKSLVKEYVLPWRELIMETAFKSDEFKIFISNPNVEILLLVSRIIIKSGVKKNIKATFNSFKLSDDMDREYKYLKNLINEKELKCLAEEMFTSSNAQLIVNIIMENSTINSSNFVKLRRIIRKELRNFKRINGFSAIVNSKILRIKDLKNKFFSRKLGQYYITKKVTPSGGKIIAFIGVDGCGKSTLSSEITSWLNYKIEVKRFYMGEGDGQVTIFAAAIKKVYSIVSKRGKKVNGNKIKGVNINNKKQISLTSNPKTFIKKYVHSLLIYSVVKNNKKKILKMHKYRLNGGFSILDRYPQLQHEGMNDGLKLGKYSAELKSNKIKKLAKKERKLMEITKIIYPDIVFRLNIRPEFSMARKPEEQTDYEAIKYKADACKTLLFPNSKLIEINAEEELKDVILTVKKKIWSEI